MRKALLCLVAIAMVWGLGAVALRAARGPESHLKLIERQQKIARKQLKSQEKIWKRSFHGRHISRAERLEEKHQFQRNMRKLREQQKDQIQEIKDRQRLLKYRNSHPIY